jgi:hypothetical protein
MDAALTSGVAAEQRSAYVAAEILQSGSGRRAAHLPLIANRKLQTANRCPYATRSARGMLLQWEQPPRWQQVKAPAS